MPTLTIDDIKVEVPEGTSVLNAARQAGISIPTLCHLEGRATIGACRVCLVEIEGARTLVASCSQPANEGMVVHTNARRGARRRAARWSSCSSRSTTATARSARAAPTASCATSPASSASTSCATQGERTARTIDTSHARPWSATPASASCAAAA